MPEKVSQLPEKVSQLPKKVAAAGKCVIASRKGIATATDLFKEFSFGARSYRRTTLVTRIDDNHCSSKRFPAHFIKKKEKKIKCKRKV